ncbi:endonuclease/exonuclease/phosphatase family protein [Actinomadura parmotrematis]|uniref:Endonuclease/exonuclease/phosphatase family protein n=1 Tax=Actinomadura parmotrematis TaxID=2864039 RepID=A0ABS7G347_9ACTN|nr:endonuclease/exonuclease/phosphatase family protein [Actinomadura parmotrematis]MBW8487144.1 endonuclease/exonuclease/phosphatase family protein [Actinomadura parmotrematis]
MTTVGTWNLENLFRPGGPFGPRDQGAYDAKLAGLAAAVAASGADVLAVQEVGETAALAELAGRLGGDWQQVTSAHYESGHPIRVGFLSRLPFEVVADTAAFPDGLGPVQSGDGGEAIRRAGRGLLAVRVAEAGGGALVLVAAHLKSKLLSFPPGPSGRPRFQPADEGERARVAAYALYRRTAEAVTARALADRLLEGRGEERQVVVMGDLNDGPEAATTQILLGPPGSELGTPGADRPDGGDGARLWNLAPRIPEDERYSRVYRGRRELIDHLLVSRALLGRAAEVRTLRAGGGGLPSVGDDPAARRDAPASDHALLFTRLGPA